MYMYIYYTPKAYNYIAVGSDPGAQGFAGCWGYEGGLIVM